MYTERRCSLRVFVCKEIFSEALFYICSYVIILGSVKKHAIPIANLCC